MSTATVAVIVIVAVLVIAALGFLGSRQQQRRHLRERFGPEYDRAVERHGSVREAEQELRAREQRHRELQIHPLDPAVRDRYRADWQRVQERFVDSPRSAVAEADDLLIRAMEDRGYPTEDYEQQVADLSVEHGGTIGRYRTAHDIRGRADAGQTTTEDLRQAMVHYRALFADLLGDGEGHVGRASAEDGRVPASGDGRQDRKNLEDHEHREDVDDREDLEDRKGREDAARTAAKDRRISTPAGGHAASRRDSEDAEGRTR
ncbi:hypothetical protein [Actinoallomurus sp. NPDC050550]|uniref:hypothetical protein n=1 Tax=Actinoallomurus sp. NPDC050550 TaxID=3154937 RepID=UPI0033C055F1